MNTNEAMWDRILRVALGLVLLSLAFMGPQTPWGYVGFVPLLTGLAGYCPLLSNAGDIDLLAIDRRASERRRVGVPAGGDSAIS